MSQFLCNGFENASSKRITLVRDQDRQAVLVEGRPYMKWLPYDEIAERIAIVQLYELKVGSQEEIAAAFGISVKSVYNYVKIFAGEGSVGLIKSKKGPKNKWKINAEVRAKVLYIFLREGLDTYEQIRERLASWGEDVGITSIRQVLIENGLVKEVSIFSDPAEQRELFPIEEKQLHFEFDGAEGAGQEEVLSESSERYQHGSRAEHKRAAGFSETQRKARRHYSPGQRMYLDQLKQGSYNTYAGGLLFIPFLQQYPFLPAIKSTFDLSPHEGYNLEELCQTLFYFDVFGFRSMEDFKRAYPEEFGVLIGRTSSPSFFTIRRFLHQVRKLAISEELTQEFAQMYLRTGLARWGVLYIDAHFLPYYGMCPITKGWHGVRQMAMKGSYHFLGVDEKFIPWIFLVRSSAEDLLEKIPEMIGKAKEAARGAGVSEKQREELIVVFDREGFSGELYGYLDGRDRDDQRKRAVFVSWAKYADRWVYEIPEQKFNKKAVVSYEIRKAEEQRYFETERRMSKYGKIRAIVVERETDRKRMAIYTNGSPKEIASEKVVQVICRRWGEENLIKELLAKHFINYMPGYVSERMEEQPLVDNPRVKQLKKQRGSLASELHKLKVQLADKILKEAKDETNWEGIKQKEIGLLTEIVGKENEMLFLDQELGSLPAKLPYDQVHQGKKLQKLNYEKKRFLDCIKVYAYNAHKRMCNLLLEYYEKEKEIFPALSMIVKRGGNVKLQGGRLRVRLKRFKNPEIDYAARALCEDLNRMEPRTLDKFQLPIRFEVS